jgi:hypothetical protein
MSEGLFPVVLHQDPRYFVKGTEGFWKRTGWNAVAAGVSILYYP